MTQSSKQRIKYLFQVLGLNPRSGVTDAHDDTVIGLAGQYPDIAALRQGLDRIQNKVLKHLPELGRIPADKGKGIREIRCQPDLLKLELPRKQIEQLVQQVVQIDFGGDGQNAGFIAADFGHQVPSPGNLGLDVFQA